MKNKGLMATLLLSASIVALALGIQPLLNEHDTNRVLRALEQINQTHREVDIVFGIIGLNESKDLDIMEKILNITNNDSEMFDAIHNNITFDYH